MTIFVMLSCWFQNVFGEIGKSFTEKDMERMRKLYDLDGDGQVKISELIIELNFDFFSLKNKNT